MPLTEHRLYVIPWATVPLIVHKPVPLGLEPLKNGPPSAVLAPRYYSPRTKDLVFRFQPPQSAVKFIALCRGRQSNEFVHT